MRCVVGILCLALALDVLAQARGEVESVGFGGAYRPGTWTPMVVHLTATTGSEFRGRIEVVQDDLDRDQVIFTRQISLTGNPSSGPAREERYWMYFMPQPTRDRGELRSGLTLAELSEIIKVRLCSESGKELVKLPITQGLTSLEGGGTGGRGARAVLCVHDQNRPDLDDFGAAVGVTEDVRSIPVRKVGTELPDDVRGYDAIDAIVWTDADATALSPEQTAAIEAFVRRGGRLVVCQDTEKDRFDRNKGNKAFWSLLPAVPTRIETREAPDQPWALRQLARVRKPESGWAFNDRNRVWDDLKGPFRSAEAEVQAGATVALWQVNEKGLAVGDAAGRPKPYVVRRALGAGCVTWVAQDLGSPALRMASDRAGRMQVPTTGWVYVWNTVFDWSNDPMFDPGNQQNQPPPAASVYREGVAWELGRSYLQSMNLDSTSAALIGIAVLFFVAYWVAAGPGSFLLLAKRGRSSMSWFAFAAIAILATGLTVGIVKLVLRGAPQLKHFTVVRMAPGEPTSVHSRMGLYVPRDGYQRIELKDAAKGRASYVIPFNLHPAFNTDASDFPARQEYAVPVREIAADKGREAEDPKSIRVPYRSTLKKLAAHWVGEVKGGIEGGVTLSAEAPIVRGSLVNTTGRELRNVYLVVHHPAAEAAARQGEFEAYDVVLYVASWADGGTLSMDELFGKDFEKAAPRFRDVEKTATAISGRPAAGLRIRGVIAPDRSTRVYWNWTEVWYRDDYRKGWGGGEVKADDLQNPASFPLLSFYGRLPPSKSGDRSAKENSGRFDFLRRGVRDLDMSSSISGGQMAVIGVSGRADEPLPFPLEVEGDRIEGKGVVFYQFVVPVDRSAVTKAPAVPPPTTGPATKPIERKAEG